MVKLTEAQIKDLKKEFEAVDENKDGKVDRKEMTVMFEKMKAATKQDFDVKMAVDNIFTHFDADKDGHIDFDEYMCSVVPKDAADKMRDEFKKIDSDGDGKIDKKELTEMFKKCGPANMDIEQVVENIFKAFDTDGSGEIDFDEYLAFSS